MKKVIVVCRAGLRSSKCPCPIPSSCQRNSLRPLDWRPTFWATSEGEGGCVRAFATPTAVAGWIFPGGKCLSGTPGIWPGLDLLKKFISVPGVSAGLHGHSLGPYSCTTGGLRRGAIILRIIGAGDLHFAMNLRALSDGNPHGCDIPTDFSRRPNFHALAAPQCALHFSTNDNLARIDVRRNLAVGSDGDAAIGELDGALNLAIDVQVFAPPYFSLDQ